MLSGRQQCATSPRRVRTGGEETDVSFGGKKVDNSFIVTERLRHAALMALHFGHPGNNKICSDGVVFWRSKMRFNIEKKAKTCHACLNAG